MQYNKSFFYYFLIADRNTIATIYTLKEEIRTGLHIKENLCNKQHISLQVLHFKETNKIVENVAEYQDVNADPHKQAYIMKNIKKD